MLDVMECMMKELGFVYMRMDGCTAVKQRSALVDRFNNDPNVFIILLTTKTGGVGISLTSADRVGNNGVTIEVSSDIKCYCFYSAV